MVLVCPGCKNQITLDDGTVPEGVFKVRCTGCGKIITSQRGQESPPSSISSSGVSDRKAESAGGTPAIQNTADGMHGAQITPAVQEFVKNEIAAAKKEILNAMQSLFRGNSMEQESTAETFSSKKALICSGELITSQTLTLCAKNMGYQTEKAVTVADSLKSLDTFYSLILIDPSFAEDADGGKKIIGRANTHKASDRRQMFVVLISPSLKTLDGNAAFMNGVNLVVNKADLSTLESSIRQSQRDFQQMYSTYFEVARM